MEQKVDKKTEGLVMDNAERLMNVEEVAKRLRTSRAVTTELLRLGWLKSVRFGSEYRIPKFALHEFIVDNIGVDILEKLEAVGAE